MNMTPYEIQIAIHYHVCDAKWDGEWSNLALETHARFVKDGLLMRASSNGDYKATDRLHAHVLFLCDMPLPVSSWKLPDYYMAAEPRGRLAVC